MFRDRADAGLKLGALLAARGWRDPVVLALPRGAVPVAAQVARLLDAELDVFVVRKIGSPGQPELGMGAVTEDGSVVVSERIVQVLGVTDAEFDRARAAADEQVRRRVHRFRGTRPLLPIAGRDAIVVDDGLATGVTAEAALRSLARHRPASLVLAAPVGAPDAVDRLGAFADMVICVEQPEVFGAVGAHYVRFGQTSSAEVVQTLRQHATERAARARDGERPDPARTAGSRHR